MSMPAPEETPRRSNPLHLALAFASGGLLTLMAHFNGTLGFHGGPLFASWTAHATGTVAALVFLAILALLSRGKRAGQSQEKKARAPLWAYLGGVSGALTVILTSESVNSPVALSGTLALGLAGQVAFSLAADMFGLLGLSKRRLTLNDFGSVALIAAGSALIILFGRGAP